MTAPFTFSSPAAVELNRAKADIAGPLVAFWNRGMLEKVRGSYAGQ